VKLLLDQNLAPSLKRRLADLCPDISHVEQLNLAASSDETIWAMALQESSTIVTKDDDFRIKSILLGHPPKVIYLKIGNCPLSQVEHLLRHAWRLIEQLHNDPSASLLLITHESVFLLVHVKAR